MLQPSLLFDCTPLLNPASWDFWLNICKALKLVQSISTWFLLKKYFSESFQYINNRQAHMVTWYMYRICNSFSGEKNAQFLSKYLTSAPAAYMDILQSKLIRDWIYISFRMSLDSVSGNEVTSTCCSIALQIS